MWYQYVRDSFLIEPLYRRAPDLEGVEITAVKAFDEGSSMLISFYLSKFADIPPKEWGDFFNTVNVVLVFEEITNFYWSGWNTIVIANIDLEKVNGGCQVSICGDDIKMIFKVKNIRIDSIRGLHIDRNLG